MKAFRKNNLSIIICLSIIFLVTFNSPSYGNDLEKLLKKYETHVEKKDQNRAVAREFCDLTSGTYSEKDDLNRAVVREFGDGFSIADWQDLKAFRNIDGWIANMGLHNNQTFMVTVNGKYIFSGNRQYFVHYSTTGMPPSGFLVHDKINKKLFLGSWFGEKRNILVINKGGRNDGDHNPPIGMGNGRNYGNFNLTSRTYSEKDDLNRAVAREFGNGFLMADWEDLKAIRNIDAWISDMRLRNEQSFFVTRNGKFIYSGNRQYNVQYFASGKVPSNYLVHDQIGNRLFLGSWYDLNEPILVIEKGNQGSINSGNNYGNFNLTSRTYSEKDDLNRAVAREFGNGFSIADWEDLKAIRNIDAWISDMRLRNEQSFFVTRNGKFIYSGNRQYNVQYFASGKVPSNYAIHDQIGNRLFLGSWYDLNEPILTIKKGNHGSDIGGNIHGNFNLTSGTYSEKEDLNRAVVREFGDGSSIADWDDLKAIPNIDAWISYRKLMKGQTFFVSRDGKFTFSGNRQYFVYYSPTGVLPSGFLAHDRIGNKLFLGSWFGERRQILVRDYRNR